MSFLWQLRLTPCFFDEPEELLSEYLRHKILKYFQPNRYLIAEERTDKKGRTIKTHYHINMETDKELKTDTVQKWFREQHICRGNKAYSVKYIADPNDEDRWWRYTCKENLIHHRGFSKEKIEEYTLLAKDERKRQIETNLASEKAQENKNQKRDKLFKWLKDEKPNLKGTRDIFCAMVFWYRSVAKDTPPLANKCLLNKVFDYQMEIGVLTAEEYFDEQYG